MANLWLDGFEASTDTSQGPRYYVFTQGGLTKSTGRIEGDSTTMYSVRMTTRSFGEFDGWYSGFGIRLTGDPTDGTITMQRGGLEQLRLVFIDNAGTGFQIEIRRGATLLATSTTTYAYNAWHYIEWSAIISTTIGEYEVRVNEVQDAGATDLAGTANTANTGVDGADQYHWDWPDTSGAPLVDDWYINNDQGGVNDGFWGDTLIKPLRVTANGNQNDWTRNSGAANYEMVDDVAVSDGSNTIESDTNGQIDLFELSNLGTVTGTILSVQVEISSAMTTSGSRVLRPRLRDTTATPGEAAGTNFTVNDTSFETFTEVFDINPVRSLAWTESEINGLEIGPEVVS